jgi:diguanylate cyclase (GGDEF)-like protein/PAS domain S-box-containing protein
MPEGVTVAGPTGLGRGSFVVAWAKVLADSGYVATDRAALHERVGGLVDTLTVALRAEQFSPAMVEPVGADLVALRLITADALARTIELIGTTLAESLGAPASPDRVPKIQAAVATGFVRAAQSRIFREQESLRRSALEARDGAENARKVSEARFRAMFADAAIGIAISDTRGQLLEVNDAMATMLDHQVDDMLGCYLADFVHPDDPPELHRYFVEMVAGQRDNYRIERRFRKRDGSALRTNVTVSLVRDEHGQPLYMVGMVEDNTDRHVLSEQLRHQANHDHLTKLANRAFFTERLHAAFGGPRGQRVGLCYLDLDGFKAVNDTLGHVVGDQLLVEIGKRLDELVSAQGRLVARMGGDEFVVLVEHTSSLNELVALAEEILAVVATPVLVSGHRLSVSASIGLVERSVFDASPAETMRDADVTLHWAKVDGKNRWAAYDPERNAREIARITLSAAMPAALEREEFYVDYQPIVSFADGTLIGVEALVRWAHPEFGRLGPDRFIGLAEETGLIVPLGRWVLETACRQAMKWRAMGATPIVSVNLAARQVAEPGLVADVSSIISEVGIPPTSLQLELTESAIMGTTGEPLSALRTLVDLGIRIAIDDFGTGYSNLAYLKHLPVHALKIAGSFVEGLRAGTQESVDAQIVTALVKLAHTLKLDVVAEGVETTEQADLLRLIGADSAQGWLYAKPGPPEDVERWLT